MYEVSNPLDRAMSGMSQASGSYSSMMQNIPANQDPGPTVGGGIMAGMGGAATAAQAGSALATIGETAAAGAVGGPGGMAIGALLGIGAYLFS